LSNRAQGTQEIRFFGKSDFSNRVSKRTQESYFLEKSDFSNRAKVAQEIRFFWKNRISFEMEWSGNFRFRVLVFIKRRQTSRVGQVDSAFVVISFFSEIFFHQNLVI
jgi:hypothetical protein